MTDSSKHDDVLELSGLAPARRPVRIRTPDDPDGTMYELAERQDFGTVQLARLGRMLEQHDKLIEKRTLTAAEEKRADALLDELAAHLIIGAPREVLAAVHPVEKRDLVLAFFTRAGRAVYESMARAGVSPSGSS